MTLLIHTYESRDPADTRWRAALEDWKDDEADTDPFDTINSAGGDSEREAVANLRAIDPRAIGVVVSR